MVEGGVLDCLWKHKELMLTVSKERETEKEYVLRWHSTQRLPMLMMGGGGGEWNKIEYGGYVRLYIRQDGERARVEIDEVDGVGSLWRLRANIFFWEGRDEVDWLVESLYRARVMAVEEDRDPNGEAVVDDWFGRVRWGYVVDP